MIDPTTYRVGDFLDVEVGYPDEFDSASEYEVMDDDMEDCHVALIPTSSDYRTTGCQATEKTYLDELDEMERLELALEDIEYLIEKSLDADSGADIGSIMSAIEDYATDVAGNAIRLAKYMVIDVTGDRDANYQLVVDVEEYRAYTGNCQPWHVLEKQLREYARESIKIINSEYRLVRVIDGDLCQDIRTNEYVDADNLLDFLSRHGWNIGKRHTVKEF